MITAPHPEQINITVRNTAGLSQHADVIRNAYRAGKRVWIGYAGQRSGYALLNADRWHKDIGNYVTNDWNECPALWYPIINRIIHA